MLSMMMSIAHRITGAALFFGSVLFVGWLFSAAHSESLFDCAQAFFGHWFGRLVLFGFTWALMHHAFGGLRHFLWDTGRGFGLATVEKLVWANLIGSIIFTILLWVLAYGVMP